MTLHPIAVVDQVLDEYRSYLQTEFRARDEKLRRSLEQALDEPRFLAQEPFLQAHRPFVSGKRWDAIGLDPGLAKVMTERSGKDTAYLHQSDAIERLLGADAGPVVVTTGTGSGKTECFLLPVLQNAIEDSVRFNRTGLTAILVYPMNALANDQLERIDDYLKASGHTHVRVGRYDRSTPEEDRQRWRRAPPHVLLTNYMMLEYLLVRPADRDDLFANHRCRFIVLDEVHSYRGALGANIALLFRRLVTHLKHARQDWQADDTADQRRFPSLIPVATSATIKSVEEAGRTPEEVRQLRDDAVQGFLASLTGFPGPAFRVLGESIEDIAIPAEARWATLPSSLAAPAPGNAAAVHEAVAALASGSPDEPLDALVRRAAIFWKLGEWLARKPMSLSQIVDRVMADVPERADADPDAVRREVSAALVAGAALPDGMPGSLRLRTHRFIRGGWRFYRCVDPGCGKLYPMGEERCACGMPTAPLYLCRSCGAHTLRFRGAEKPDDVPLTPSDARDAKNEWVLYERAEGAETDEDTELVGLEQQMKDRPVLKGSFEPSTCAFSLGDEFPVPVVLAPARNRCLVCGGTAGSRAVLTPVALGTSAAVRVVAEGLVEALAEQNQSKPKHDRKERLLVFADSRQDAAHQARFITYAGRYDRMRRLLVWALREAKGPMTVEQAVQALMVKGVEIGDNPRTEQYRDAEYLPQPVQENARAWEEAPLLDDLAVGAAYRATVFNLGLVGVRYEHLDHYVESKGKPLAAELGIDTAQLAYLARWLLDEMRWRGALSRPLLAFHPASPNCPDALPLVLTGSGACATRRAIRAPIRAIR